MAIDVIFKQDYFVRQVLIVMKKTKFELDREIYPDLDFYKKLTQIQNNSFEKIYSSHLRQIESRAMLQKKVFPNAEYVFRDALDYLNPREYDLVISLGGDNHFTYVAHHIFGVPLLGCNSDEKTSIGALLAFTPQTLEATVLQAWRNIQYEEWSMVYGTILYPDGRSIQTVSCVNEISIRNSSPDLISRYVLEYNGHKEEQKSSGLLLYTGAGSTGWYASCVGLRDIEEESFPKDAPYFKVFSRELSRRARNNFKLTDFAVPTELKVTSEMYGGISIDSLPERIYNFPPGAVAIFKLSSEKLKVVTQKSSL